MSHPGLIGHLSLPDSPVALASPTRSDLKKQKINITLDPDVVAWFKTRAGGRGYQTLMNAALREAMGRATLEETLRRVLREEMRPPA